MHMVNDVGSTFLAHLALVIIQLAHLAVETLAAFTDGLHVGHIVQVALDTFNAGYDGLDLLVAHHGADTTASGLLEADLLALHIEKSKVDHADE